PFVIVFLKRLPARSTLFTYTTLFRSRLEDGHVKFVPDDGGFVTIFKHPVRGAAYVIGTDESEGLAHGDYSAANVLDRNLRHVARSEEHTSELQSRENLVCRLLLEKTT